MILGTDAKAVHWDDTQGAYVDALGRPIIRTDENGARALANGTDGYPTQAEFDAQLAQTKAPTLPPGTFPPLLKDSSGLTDAQHDDEDRAALYEAKGKADPVAVAQALDAIAKMRAAQAKPQDAAGQGVPGDLLSLAEGATPGQSAPVARDVQSIASSAPPLSPQAQPQDANGIPSAVRDYVNRYAQQQDGLRQAQGDAAFNRLAAGLGQAGATVGAALGRTQPQTEFWQQMSANANQPVEDFRQRQALELVRQKMDPTSAENQRVRDAWASKLPDLAKQPGWSQVTADDIPKFLEDEKFRAQLAAAEKQRQATLNMEGAKLAEDKRYHDAQMGIQPLKLQMEHERTNATVNSTNLRAGKFNEEREQAQVPGFDSPTALAPDDAAKGRSMLAANETVKDYLRGLMQIAALPVSERATPTVRQRAETLRNSAIAAINLAQQMGGFTDQHKALVEGEIADLNGLLGTADPDVVRASLAQVATDLDAYKNGWAKAHNGKFTGAPDARAGGDAATQIQRGTDALSGGPKDPSPNVPLRKRGKDGNLYEKRADGWYRVSDGGPINQS